MSKAHKFVFFAITIIATFFAVYSGYMYSKNNTNKTENSQNETSNEEISATNNIKNESQNTSGEKASEVSNKNERPSSPTDVVTVAQNDTLFTIGQANDVSYLLLAEANGIDADKIKVGDKIAIPKNNQISFSINSEQAKKLQSQIAEGKNLFRYSSLETARADCPTYYGLSLSDAFSIIKQDITSGLAEIQATHDGKQYLITLSQPETKGEKGIWAITTIKPN